MFRIGKKEKTSKNSPANPENVSARSESPNPEDKKPVFFSRMISGLSRTRGRLGEAIETLVHGEKTIDARFLEDIETLLLSADVGIEASDQIISRLKQQLDRKQLSAPSELLHALKAELQMILDPCEVPLHVNSSSKPFVILVVGVNGVGKTTTIGKLAKRLQSQGEKVMLAAGDTFRAAAVEQLQVWGDHNELPVVAQETGADSASVIFDAYQSAKAKEVDVLIADTAGRLHTKDNLMKELEKIVRVLKKQDERLPDETLLVLDATTGQNALSQAESFHASTEVTGITLTKLDGTAKGGVIFAIAKQLGLPIRFVGVGEEVGDLRPFEAQKFVAALFVE